MTTDGYWNDQAESTNVLGGPVDIVGTKLVGQQDGVLDAYSTNTSLYPATVVNRNVTPRPIWEGFPDGKKVVSNKTTNYQYAPCGTYFYQTKKQISRSTSQLVMTTSQTIKNTAQKIASTLQYLTTRLQTLQTTQQTQQSTQQNSADTVQFWQDTSQSVVRTEQMQQSTLQYLKSTDQVMRHTEQIVRDIWSITAGYAYTTRRTESDLPGHDADPEGNDPGHGNGGSRR